MKKRGIVAKTGFKYGSHFRAYEGDPERTHAKYLVHALPATYRGMWPEVIRAVRLAHGVKKQLLLGAGGEEIVRYIRLQWGGAGGGGREWGAAGNAPSIPAITSRSRAFENPCGSLGRETPASRNMRMMFSESARPTTSIHVPFSHVSGCAMCSSYHEAATSWARSQVSTEPPWRVHSSSAARCRYAGFILRESARTPQRSRNTSAMDRPAGAGTE